MSLTFALLDKKFVAYMDKYILELSLKVTSRLMFNLVLICFVYFLNGLNQLIFYTRIDSLLKLAQMF